MIIDHGFRLNGFKTERNLCVHGWGILLTPWSLFCLWGAFLSYVYVYIYIYIYDDVIKLNISRVTGPLCGEFTGHQIIPLTKTSDAELWCFSLISAWTNGRVNNRHAGYLRRHRSHYDVTLIIKVYFGWYIDIWEMSPYLGRRIWTWYSTGGVLILLKNGTNSERGRIGLVFSRSPKASSHCIICSFIFIHEGNI